MNYIEQINNFWAYTEDKHLNSGDISVYFALLKYNNSLNWIKYFRCDYGIICQYSGVSKNKFYISINKLQDIGLILYEKGQRNVLKPRISILKIKNRKGTIKEQYEEQHEEQKGNLYKLLNNKTIKLLNYNASIVNINLEFWLNLEKENDDNFIDSIIDINKKKLFLKWLNYRKEIKKPIKIKSTLKGLVADFNNYTFEEIKVAINQSINNNYTGLFLKKEKSSEKKETINRQTREVIESNVQGWIPTKMIKE